MPTSSEEYLAILRSYYIDVQKNLLSIKKDKRVFAQQATVIKQNHQQMQTILYFKQ